ncbi:MAG: DegV family protein [Proteobacteria bacterium]|nr:DegV family protein [Pseudomonadota bacterium]
MGEKIGIVADSTADFPEEIAEKLGVRSAPIHVYVDGENFLDGVTISKQDVVDALKNGSTVHTAPPTPHEYAEIYDDMLQTHDRIISLHVSSQFSDCYKSAKNSLNLLFEDQEDKVEIIDTGSVSGGQALIVKKARELILEGVSTGKLYKRLAPFMKNSPLCFTVADLKWLKKGGRIGTLAAMFGTLLNIKPVIGLIKAELKPVGKYRGKDQAILGMIKKAVEISKQIPGGYDIWVSHIDDPEGGNFMRESLAKQLDKTLDDIKMVEIGSTIAAHCGPGSCGWAMMPSFK